MVDVEGRGGEVVNLIGMIDDGGLRRGIYIFI